MPAQYKWWQPWWLVDFVERLLNWVVSLCIIAVLGGLGWHGYGLLKDTRESMSIEATAVQNLVPIELNDRTDGRIAMVEPNTGRLYMVPVTAINPD